MILNNQPRDTPGPRILNRNPLPERRDARLVIPHEPAGGGRLDFLEGVVCYSDRGVNAEGAGECLEGRNVWDARLGDEVSVHEDVAWACHCQVVCEANFVVGRTMGEEQCLPAISWYALVFLIRHCRNAEGSVRGTVTHSRSAARLMV